jgi:hypothetical protein
VYDNTGPGSVLRALFAYIPTWYGNQDVFAQMAREMPLVFQDDYAARQVGKARDMAAGRRVDPWDLTGFLVKEVGAMSGDSAVDEAIGARPSEEVKREVSMEDKKATRRSAE